LVFEQIDLHQLTGVFLGAILSQMKSSINFVFSLTKTRGFGREREQEGYTYQAQRIDDDNLRRRPILGDGVEAGSPEKLAEEVAKLVFKKIGSPDKDFSWNFDWHSVENENKRKGVIAPYEEDFNHDDFVRFQTSLPTRTDTVL
jgi:hypothetical protein